MDREPDARGCRGLGHWLRGAPGGICAGISRSTGLRRPIGLSAAGPASPQQRARSCSDGGLAATSGGSGSYAGATGPAPADSRRGAFGPSGGSGRGHSGRSRSLLCLGAGLLFLERRLDMDRWPMGGSPQARRRLGGRPLGETRPRLCLVRRPLAVAGSARALRPG